MRIAFDHHLPFLLAHGGFQLQIEQTLNALRTIGVDAEWLRFWDAAQQPDVIHFFGKPDSAYLRFARGKGIKTVVNELLTGLGSRSKLKLRVQSTIVGTAKRMCPRAASRMGWDAGDIADALVALTPHEAGLMDFVFHAPQEKIHVVPNGVADVFLQQGTEQRQDWLLCTAVIHPRKRVLELAEAATAARTPLRIYGRPYDDRERYFRDFLQVVQSSGGLVQWCGELTDQEELARVYRRAKGFVLLSTMESLSLSALEAAACATPLLLTDLPWATTTFGENANYAPNTGRGGVIAAHLQKFYDSPGSPAGFQPCSWTQVARRLQRLYDSLRAT
jgi:glycosyltransferase involved in cell wall biosynthesis